MKFDFINRIFYFIILLENLINHLKIKVNLFVIKNKFRVKISLFKFFFNFLKKLQKYLSNLPTKGF